MVGLDGGGGGQLDPDEVGLVDEGHERSDREGGELGSINLHV